MSEILSGVSDIAENNLNRDKNFQAYRDCRQEIAKCEEMLEEFSSAIEDFQLIKVGEVLWDNRHIFCSSGAYKPNDLINQTKEQARRLQKLATLANVTRAEVLANIAITSKSVCEYKVLKAFYIDDVESEFSTLTSFNVKSM